MYVLSHFVTCQWPAVHSTPIHMSIGMVPTQSSPSHKMLSSMRVHSSNHIGRILVN